MNVSAVFKVEIFIPTDCVDELLEALAEAGAGVIGNYDHCFAVSQLTSSFRPLAGAAPSFGNVGELMSTGESKVEVNVHEESLAEVVRITRELHPYEEPLINVIPLANARYGATM